MFSIEGKLNHIKDYKLNVVLYFYLLSVFPTPRFPAKRCLGILFPMKRSASPLRPFFLTFFEIAL